MLKNMFFILTLATMAASSLAQNADADAGADVSQTADLPRLTIYRHSAWSETPAKGVDADGKRMNIGPGESFEFGDLKISLSEMTPSPAPTQPDQVTISLNHKGTSESRTLDEGAAFNWNGYHIAIVAIYAKKGDLGFGLTVVEVATVASLPKEVAESTKANGAAHRLRVKHDINKLTLHHSATPHAAGQDLPTKLRNLQKWGENDRNWFDLAYHFMVDLDGTIYEARNYKYVGDTNTRYDPRGHFLVNCFGNYSEAEPNEQQLQAIATLMAWAAAEFKVEPLHIYGHRDLTQTACPGDNLYKHIADGSLKKRVEAILAKGKPQLTWSDQKPPAPSTN